MNIRIKLWSLVTNFYPWFLRRFYKMNIGFGCRIAMSAHLDKSVNPKGIHIGDHTWVLREAMILAHDHCRRLRTDVRIGNNCVIGIRSIILPGVKIGNQVIVGAGSIVTKDIPDNCIVVGNPAKVIRTGINVKYGQIIDG